MSLDEKPIRLVSTGSITITADEISIDGFDGENTSCREVAAFACLWAIGQLQTEVTKLLEAPGTGNASVD